MALNENGSKEVFLIKEEIIDIDCMSTTDLLGSIKQELITLKKKADCEITDLLISRPKGTVKYEVLPAENNEPSSLRETSDMNEVNGDDQAPTTAKNTLGLHTDSIVDCDSFSCNQCSFVGINKMGLSLHRRRKHGIGNAKHRIRCHHCGAMISKDRFEIHQKVHVSGPFSCSKCNFKGTRSEIWKHRRREHDLRPQTSRKQYRSKNNYSCTICHLKYQNSSRLERHKTRHRIRSNYGCKNCSTFFDNVWSLEFHASSKCEKSDKMTLRCPFCDRTYSTQHYLEYHKRTKHTSLLSQEELEKPLSGLTCTPCGRTFSNKNAMCYHKIYHHRNIQRCPYCNTLTRFLKTHISQIHSLKCKKCSISFKTEIEFDLHLLSHRKKNSSFPPAPKCQYCYHTFASKRGLIYHQQKNVCRKASLPSNSSNQLPPVSKKKCKPNSMEMKCKKCLISFETEIEFDLHLLSHHYKGNSSLPPTCHKKKYKPNSLKCKKCPMSFKTEVEFDLHLLSHREGNPSLPPTCQYCYHTFASKGGLIYHLQRNVYRKASLPSNSSNHLAAVSRTRYKPNKNRKSIQSRPSFQSAESNNQGYKEEPQICEQPFIKLEAIDPEVENLGGNANELLEEIETGYSSTATVKPSYDHVCDFCLKRFTTLQSLTRHKQKNVCRDKVTERKLSSDPCPGCQEIFESVEFLKRHMKYCVLL